MSRAALDQPRRYGPAQSAQTSYEQVRSIASQLQRLGSRRGLDLQLIVCTFERHLNHNLANVLRALHEPKGLRDGCSRICLHRCDGRNPALVIHVDHLLQQPLHCIGPLGAEHGKVQARERPGAPKRLHVQHALADDVAEANLDHGAKLGDAGPRRVKKIPRQRVENQINTLAGCSFHDVLQEGRRARVEDALARLVEVVDEVLHLFFRADRCVDLKVMLAVA